MLVFPQLSSGTGAQYPVEKICVRRTVHNLMADGSLVSFVDPDAGLMRWNLQFHGLNTAEAGSLQTLFDAAAGRLRPFTFVDPAANLLAWSEDFTQPAWQAAPLLQVTGGLPDPLGGNRATRLVNAGQAPQSISQTVALPASFTCCLSVYVRADVAGAITLLRSAASASQSTPVAVGTAWTRVVSAGALAGSDTAVTFGFGLAPGVAVQVYGAQVEAQPAPSAYMATRVRAGIYAAARFDQDRLTTTAQAPGLSDATIRIITPSGF